MSRPIVTIDATKPVSLVEVDDVMNNQFWKFCTDDPMSDVDAYTEFDIAPNQVLAAGTTVVIHHLWGHSPLGMTESADYEVTLTKDATMERAVYVILSRYHADMNHIGGTGRFYYVEQATMVGEAVKITLGT